MPVSLNACILMIFFSAHSLFCSYVPNVPEGFDVNGYHNDYLDDVVPDFDFDDQSAFSVFCMHVLCISTYFCVCLF